MASLRQEYNIPIMPKEVSKNDIHTACYLDVGDETIFEPALCSARDSGVPISE